MEAFADWEWESLSKMLTFEEPDFASSQLFIDDQNCSQFDYSNINALFSLNSCQNDSSQDTSTSSSYENGMLNEYNHIALPNDQFFPTNFLTLDGESDALLTSIFPHNVSETGVSEDSQSSQLGSSTNMDVQLKRKCSSPDMVPEKELQIGALASPTKKARVSKDKIKKMNAKSKERESESPDQNEEESATKGGEISDDGSNASQETSEGDNTTALKGKKRASRGNATDPQSLYARKRREKINARLKILQNLVPNGTKVDISTMLEEAVHYVKFLQLQIRLLSSDDLWMYAPLAYNGVDVSLYRRISPFLLP